MDKTFLDPTFFCMSCKHVSFMSPWHLYTWLVAKYWWSVIFKKKFWFNTHSFSSQTFYKQSSLKKPLSNPNLLSFFWWQSLSDFRAAGTKPAFPPHGTSFMCFGVSRQRCQMLYSTDASCRIGHNCQISAFTQPLALSNQHKNLIKRLSLTLDFSFTKVPIIQEYTS